jgi:hypothetical protein
MIRVAELSMISKPEKMSENVRTEDELEMPCLVFQLRVQFIATKQGKEYRSLDEALNLPGMSSRCWSWTCIHLQINVGYPK